MFKNLSDSLNNVSDRFEDFGLSTMEYYKLRLFKSSMKGAISLVNLLVYGSLSLFVMVFLSMGVAMWLGTFFEHAFVGFLIVGGFYGILLIFMFLFGRKIIARKMLLEFSGLLYDEDDVEPKEAARREVAEFVASKKNEILNVDEVEKFL